VSAHRPGNQNRRAHEQHEDEPSSCYGQNPVTAPRSPLASGRYYDGALQRNQGGWRVSRLR
jgi:hypothetical protein